MAALVIANRHDIAGAGIEAILQGCGYSVIARCLHEDELLRFVEAKTPDIILLAKNIVGQEAAKAILRLRACICSVAIIFLLDEYEAITTTELLDFDVEGILLSTASAVSVIDCVDSVLHRQKWVDPDLITVDRSSQIANSLTSREAEIAHLVSRGFRNKEIARELDLSVGTVKMHLHHIYKKLRLAGRTQLAAGAHVPWGGRPDQMSATGCSTSAKHRRYLFGVWTPHPLAQLRQKSRARFKVGMGSPSLPMLTIVPVARISSSKMRGLGERNPSEGAIWDGGAAVTDCEHPTRN
jgi:DNA-binding NarL/FixJ family response regulator